MAGLFVFAMLFTVGTGFFIFVNDMNGAYVKSLSARDVAMQDQLSESLRLSTSTGADGNLTLTISNVGAVSANVTNLFVVDPAGTLHEYGAGFPTDTSPPLPLPVSVASTASPVDTGLSVVSGTYALKVVTQTGNVYAAAYPEPESSFITTSLSSLVVPAGTPVFDTARLAGVSPFAAGTVNYSYFSTGFCSGASILVSTVSVTNAVVPNSAPVTLAIPGDYSFQANYSGDGANAPASSPCEPLSVLPKNCLVSADCQALVSQGLGLIAMDFNFQEAYGVNCSSGHASDGGCAVMDLPANFNNPAGQNVGNRFSGYHISFSSLSASGWSGRDMLFIFNITNADPWGRNIVLNSSIVGNAPGGTFLSQISAANFGGSSLSGADMVLGRICTNSTGCTVGSNFYAYGMTLPSQGFTQTLLPCDFSATPVVCHPTLVYFYTAANLSISPSKVTVMSDFLELFGTVSTGGGCDLPACPYGQNLPLTITQYMP